MSENNKTVNEVIADNMEIQEPVSEVEELFGIDQLNPENDSESGTIFWPVPGNDEILVATIGGVQEIGMNLTLYGTAGRWIIVDAGVGFVSAEQRKATNITGHTVSYETLMPIADKIDGIIITHGHEDHIGGVNALTSNMNIPVYGSPFVNTLLAPRVGEHVELVDFIPGEYVDIGNFSIRTIETTHSIPESVHLFIEANEGPAKGVLHTGDWKFDESGINGNLDLKTLADLGDEHRVGALVGDSTNARRAGRTESESEVTKGLFKVFTEATDSVFVCCFASNIARIANIIDVANNVGRNVAVSGRAMVRNCEVATDLGYLQEEDLLPLEALEKLPRQNRVLVMTGSQGEEGAILARLINRGIDSNDAKLPKISSGDTLIMSARTIPGNEEIVNELLARYRSVGVNVITADMPEFEDAPIHVSGHPSSDDLRAMLSLTRPDNVIPVHGRDSDMTEHAMIAMESGINAKVPVVGSIFSVKDNQPVTEVTIVPVLLDAVMVKNKRKDRSIVTHPSAHQTGMNFTP